MWADRCVQAKGNAGRLFPTSAERCEQAMSDACNPWLMLFVVGRRRLPVAHMPRSMLEGLALCCLMLTDVAFPMLACHIRYAQALASQSSSW